MQIMGVGLDYATGRPLLDPIDEAAFARQIRESLAANIDGLRDLAATTTRGDAFRAEVEREAMDLGDPRQAGWTILVNGQDPRRHDLIDAARRLAEHRGAAEPDVPLVFNGEQPDAWFEWFLENYSVLAPKRRPHYILILGGPAQVPFLFQSVLGSLAAVGRLDFDSPDDLRAYADRVIAIERADRPTVERKALFFAPDAGPPDATHFSRRYMVDPLAKHVRERCGVPSEAVTRHDATKERLQELLHGARPALFYSASHGTVAPGQDLATQQRVNGAICCQRRGWGAAAQQWLFTADDVPRDEPFLEGGLFFQFACFGYGTPAESDFAHWHPKAPKINAAEDFIAALPRRLLAHPRGPVAYVGHLDLAFLHGFTDPDNRYVDDRWHRRIEPFVDALEKLLRVEPVGRAMANMHGRYNLLNAYLTTEHDRIRRGRVNVTPEFEARLAQAFITRSDAQNYLIFGDPAVHLRIPDR